LTNIRLMKKDDVLVWGLGLVALAGVGYIMMQKAGAPVEKAPETTEQASDMPLEMGEKKEGCGCGA